MKYNINLIVVMEDTLNANVTYSNNELNDINNNNYSANQASNSLNVTSCSCVCKKDLLISI